MCLMQGVQQGILEQDIPGNTYNHPNVLGLLTSAEPPLFTPRTLLILLSSVVAGGITVALCLNDGMGWPKALLAGLGAAGATVVGVHGVLA
ncbi:hypothetical protein ACFWY5_46650 [Nonomuraea sp. NPDC059007]|uniref:hypothetical protein n=1 Tax=Nonomuraea sp. NPDC059007 TaxID=3346692 RepID=UPI0036908404